MLLERGDLPPQGWFVGPTIVAVDDPTVPIATEEIFGPVLAVLRASDFDHALELANATDYALTAGLFSRSPVHLAARRGRAARRQRLPQPRTSPEPSSGASPSGATA